MSSIEANKRTFAMSRNLKMATVAIMLALTATGAAQARGNFDRHPHPFAHTQTQGSPFGYAGPGHWSTSVARFVPGRGIVGESCDLPTSACSNDERVTG
jgi:hypothetical protein